VVASGILQAHVRSTLEKELPITMASHMERAMESSVVQEKARAMTRATARAMGSPLGFLEDHMAKASQKDMARKESQKENNATSLTSTSPMLVDLSTSVKSGENFQHNVKPVKPRQQPSIAWMEMRSS